MFLLFRSKVWRCSLSRRRLVARRIGNRTISNERAKWRVAFFKFLLPFSVIRNRILRRSFLHLRSSSSDIFANSFKFFSKLEEFSSSFFGKPIIPECNFFRLWTLSHFWGSFKFLENCSVPRNKTSIHGLTIEYPMNAISRICSASEFGVH